MVNIEAVKMAGKFRELRGRQRTARERLDI
jgi:hypothetical protein